MIIAEMVILGLCFGSFVNALVWRLYEQGLPAKQRAANLKELSITKGRSMCPNCKHTLAAKDLIPVFSWLQLRGRCRYCKRPIGWQYPAVEVATAVLFVLSYVFWPYAFDGQGIFLLVCWLVAIVGLMALLVYDARWMLLPNKIVFPLIGLGVVQTTVNAVFFDGGIRSVIDALAAVVVAGGIFYILFQLSRGKWIGGGDVKLGYAIGLFLGSPMLAFLMLFTASLLGISASLPSLITKRMSVGSRIPFGPFLIVATMIVMLFGTAVIEWYKNHVLYLA